MVNLKNKSAAIISGLLFIVWIAAMFSFGKISLFPVHFFIAFSFGSLAFIVNMVCLLVFVRDSLELNEIKYIPLVFTIGYLIVSLTANFMFSFYIVKIGVIVFFNILCFCIAAGGNIFSGMYVKGAERKVNVIENRQSMHRLISQKMGKVLALANDEEIKKRLLNLKELSDYSNSLTTHMSEDVENALYSKLNSLESIMLQGADKEEILERIEDLIVNVKYRNTIKSV